MDFLIHAADVIQRHGFGRVLDQVSHIVHAIDQAVDVLTVQWRDEGLVQRLGDFVCHAVCGTLCVIHIADVLFAQVRIVVVSDQLRKRASSFNDAIRMLVEHFKKVAFARQEFAKQHGHSPKMMCR